MNDGCILIAADGDPHAIGALRCARDLSGRFGLPLELVSVCESPVLVGQEAAGETPVAASRVLEATLDTRRREMDAHLREAGIRGVTRLHVEAGTAASVITRVAGRRGARLIVAGHRPRGRFDRMLRDETLLRLMQTSHVPVISVPVDYAGLPRRLVVAVDFTSHSLDAARQGVAMLGEGGEVHLVHALSDHPMLESGGTAGRDWLRVARARNSRRLGELARELTRLAPRATIASHLVEGPPASGILRLAEAIDADCVAAGTHGYGFLGRLLLGSVATQLVRRANCPVLVAPPRGIVPEDGEPRVPDYERASAEG